MGRRLGKRVGGSAYWRIGVWRSETAFRHRYNDQEVSTELMMLCKRRHADTPTRRYVSPSLLFRGEDTRIVTSCRCHEERVLDQSISSSSDHHYLAQVIDPIGLVK